MRATCWMGRNRVDVIEVPDPVIMNERDAIVKITATAICGSDLHLYDGYIPTMEKGDVLGHEFMGEVVEVGPAVKNLKRGDLRRFKQVMELGEVVQSDASIHKGAHPARPSGRQEPVRAQEGGRR